ncbi:hypothetical protein LPJ56_003937 [Coemansia sp. RSA 2599]|nr:hypothetical protein LPJ56_003937 [Coemansia sp. RSA 2599]
MLLFAGDAVWVVKLPTTADTARLGIGFRPVGWVNLAHTTSSFPADTAISRLTLGQATSMPMPMPVPVPLLLEMLVSLTSPAIERLALEGTVLADACQQTSLPPVIPVVERLALEGAVEAAVYKERESMSARPAVEHFALEGAVEAVVH